MLLTIVGISYACISYRWNGKSKLTRRKSSCCCSCSSCCYKHENYREVSISRYSTTIININIAIVVVVVLFYVRLLPRCMEMMECRRGLAMRICLSVKRVYCNKTEEKSVQIFTPYERSFSLVLWEEEWLVGATPSTRHFGSTGPRRWYEIADFERIFARSASAVLSQFTRLTDGQADGRIIVIAIPRVCIPCSAVKIRVVAGFMVTLLLRKLPMKQQK